MVSPIISLGQLSRWVSIGGLSLDKTLADFFPSLSVATLVLVFSRFGVPATEITSYIVIGALTFVVSGVLQ